MVETLPPSVAVVGVGVMGGAIATRLLETGATVAVFDRDDAKTRALAAKGARPATSAADAARGGAFRHHQPQFRKHRRSRRVRARGRGKRRERRHPAHRHVVDRSGIDPGARRPIPGGHRRPVDRLPALRRRARGSVRPADRHGRRRERRFRARAGGDEPADGELHAHGADRSGPGDEAREPGAVRDPVSGGR